MRLEIIKSMKEIVARVFLCVDYDATIKDKKQLISVLSKNVKKSTTGYAGFRTERGFRDYLSGAIFDAKEDKEILKFNFDKKKILGLVKQANILCQKIIPSNPVSIFIFPTFSKFVKEKMFGTTGYTPWKNTILVFINPLCRQWEKMLPKTLAHEYCHSEFLKYNKCESLLDSMIFEGLAEHFREQIVGGGRAPWTKVFNQNQSKNLFLEIQSKNLLKSIDQKLYHAVFFGDKKYVRWTGYSIGYHIIESFIKSNPNLKWQEIIVMRPKDIFDKSNF